MFQSTFSIEFNNYPTFCGSCDDAYNDSEGIIFHKALETLFKDHSAGILICKGYSYGIFSKNNKFYFSDSHSCGSKGAKTPNNGKACLIQCDNISELHCICKRATLSDNVQYTMDYIDVHHIQQNIIQAQENSSNVCNNIPASNHFNFPNPAPINHNVIHSDGPSQANLHNTYWNNIHNISEDIPIEDNLVALQQT